MPPLRPLPLHTTLPLSPTTIVGRRIVARVVVATTACRRSCPVALTLDTACRCLLASSNRGSVVFRPGIQRVRITQLKRLACNL